MGKNKGNVATQLERLRKKHAALDERVRKYQQQPGHCATKLRALKRQKLALKDQISRLEAGQSNAALHQPQQPSEPALTVPLHGQRSVFDISVVPILIAAE